MKKITQISTNAKTGVSDILRQMEGAGFGAKRLGIAANILENMIRDKKCTKFMTVAGALVPAGMKGLIIEMLEKKWVDVLVITGANVTHDLIESFGGRHEQGNSSVDDKKLFDKKIDRIYDVFMPNSVYEKLEDGLAPILAELPKKEMSSREFLFEIGMRIKADDSILKVAAKNNIPIFCPAIADSGLGLQLFTRAGVDAIHINNLLDIKELVEIAWNDETVNGVFILGGGVPKNFVMQAMQFSPKTHRYAVQITMDRPEPGGLSGATLQEGISWGKIGKNAEYVDVICDITIALPFLIAGLNERLKE